MNPDRWQRVKGIVDSALEIPPNIRNAFIEKAAGGEKSLYDEVQSLLAYQSAATGFMQSPAIEIAGKILAESRTRDIAGKKVSHYQIQNRIGVGGMGEVYLAKDLALGRQVAIKLLAPGVPAGYLSRLMREAEAAVKLQHPGIATFYESGMDGETEFMAMEYVAGDTLRSRLSRGPLEVTSTIALANGLLEALVHAHAAGILHRDIKPENIMLTHDDLPKLLDFGLAIQLFPDDPDETHSIIRGIIAGTLGYMSPEQARGETDLDERSDLFSLGAVIYEAFSGQPAFPGDTGADRLAAVLYKDPAPLSSLGFSSAISDMIQRSLEKDKCQRFPSAAAFLHEVQGLSDRPIQTAISNAIAIMDFRNLSNDSADDWLGTGLAEALTADLARVPSLKIAPRERIVQAQLSSAPEKPDSLSVAQSLGCRWLIDGSFQKTGSMVRITARLTEVATSCIAVMEELDGSLKQIFAMQDRLSASVANALQFKIPSLDGAGDKPILTAYEYYNRGRQFFLGCKKGGFPRAESLYQEAIAADPRYALAHAGLAGVSAMKWTFTNNPSDLQTAKQHAYRAIELDPSLDEPHVWLGYALFRLGKYEAALEEEREAKRLGPSNRMARYFEGLILKEIGRLDEAVCAEQEAIKIDQQFANAWMVLGSLYAVLDKSTEAFWCLEHTVQMEGGDKTSWGYEARALLAEMYRRQGNTAAGMKICLESLDIIESTDHMLRDQFRASCLNILGRCALTEGNLQAAGTAFHQSVTHIKGRRSGLSAGYYIAQALAGEAHATVDPNLLEEACHIFRNRIDWNFATGIGNLEGDVAIDIGLAAAALGRAAEAQEWCEHARKQVVSQFRLGELEKAISGKKPE
jgi:serine/threonine protein kinase/Flp pilus assembly protein TadD